MSKAAKIVSVLAICACVLTAYLLASARFQAVILSVKVESAADRLDAFRSLAETIERGDLGAGQFGTLDSDDPADYAFVTYAVELKGRSPLTAEWAVLCLSPLGGDVAFLPGVATDIPPFGARTLTGTLLTRAADAGQERHLWAEYYLFGRSLSAVAEAP